jgi:hypothetical protein
MHYKQIFLTVFTITIGLALTSYTAYSANPQVTNVLASQRTDGSMLVDISYDLSDEDGDSVTISVSVSDDDGLSYDVNATSFIGDTGTEITPGTGKTTVWDAGTDLPGVYGTEYRVKVIADDGKGDESTAGYKASVVLGKALKYSAFSSKNTNFKTTSTGGTSLLGSSTFGKIVNKITKSIYHISRIKPKQIPTGPPVPTGIPTGYPTGFPTGYPTVFPYPTGIPTGIPTGYPSGGGIEGFTYNGDGTFTGTPEEGVTIKLSFYKSDGTQITVDMTDSSNYQPGGELYGEDPSTFFFISEATVSVQKSYATVNMNLTSEKAQVNMGGCPEKVEMSGTGTFEFENIGTGEATDITVTVKECGDDITGHADISITVDGTDCVISHDFNKDGCQGGPITCGGVQVGEVTRDDDGNLYYCEPDCSTGEKTPIDESVFFGSGS